jgi:hypothetical protein
MAFETNTAMRFISLFAVRYPARPKLDSVPRAPRDSRLAMPITTPAAPSGSG